MLLLAILSVIVAAPEAAPVCPATPAPLSGPLAAWNRPHDVTRFPAVASYAAIEPGRRVDVALSSDPIRFSVPPERTPTPGTHATVLGIRIALAGTYRVAIGTAAWLDLVKDGKVVESIAHDHGPTCSGIRKMVDFTLARGSYTLQLSGSPDTKSGVLVTRLP